MPDDPPKARTGRPPKNQGLELKAPTTLRAWSGLLGQCSAALLANKLSGEQMKSVTTAAAGALAIEKYLKPPRTGRPANAAEVADAPRPSKASQLASDPEDPSTWSTEELARGLHESEWEGEDDA